MFSKLQTEMYRITLIRAELQLLRMGNSDLGRNVTPSYEAQLGDFEQGSYLCTVK